MVWRIFPPTSWWSPSNLATLAEQVIRYTTVRHTINMAEIAGELELLYFDIPGKGEAIRLLCKHAGVPLKDTRLTRPEFEALRGSGALLFNQLPALRDTAAPGKTFAQSASILRYIGKKTGHYPSDPAAAALVDAVMDQEADMFAGLSASRYRDRFGYESLDEATVATVRRALNERVLPHHLTLLERIAAASSTGWIAGTEGPSVADFCLVPRLQWLAGGHNDGISTDILKPFPLLCGLVDKFAALSEEGNKKAKLS